MGEARELPVLIKYAVEEAFVDKSELAVDSDDEAKALAAQAVALEAQQRVEQETAELHRETMARLNVRVADETQPSGPFVSAVLPAGAIRELARDPRAAFIGIDQEKEVPDYPTIAESLPTTGTQTVHSSGVNGAGAKIAVLEGGSLTVSQSCFNIGAIESTTPAADSHMTKSVGIIALNALSQERFAEDLRRLAIQLPAQDYALEPTIRLTLSVPQIVGLAASSWVRAIALTGELEIPDQAE